MPTATVFSRGRVTLPLEVCRDLGIGPGSKIDFVENEDGETVIVPHLPDGRDRKAIIVNADAQDQ